jgi:MFS family permease
MFAGMVGAAFAVGEGRFLDIIQHYGLLAFTGLFFFGTVFAMASAALLIPQPDCPLPAGAEHTPLLRQIRRTFRNRGLRTVAIAHAMICMGTIASPYSAAYSLRDVGLDYFTLGLLNAIATASSLLASPLWGRAIDRFGCRPVIVLCLAGAAPSSLVWLFIPPGAAAAACWILPWANFVSGALIAGSGVAISAMIFKFSDPHHRSAQLAVYNLFIILVSAPLPAFGGWIVTRLRQSGWPVDLRLTFYLWSLFTALAAVAAWRIREPGAIRARTLLAGMFPAILARGARVAMASMNVFRASPMRRGIAPIEPDEPDKPGNADKPDAPAPG